MMLTRALEKEREAREYGHYTRAQAFARDGVPLRLFALVCPTVSESRSNPADVQS